MCAVFAAVDSLVDSAVARECTSSASNARSSLRPATLQPAADTVFVVGDVHGDVEKTKRTLSLAGLMDTRSCSWTGGRSVLVQVGDQMDRG